MLGLFDCIISHYQANPDPYISIIKEMRKIFLQNMIQFYFALVPEIPKLLPELMYRID